MSYVRRSSSKRSEPADVGVAAINEIHRLWQVDDCWSVREQRGFTWWAGDYRQQVCADEGLDDDGIVLYRLSAVTELVCGVDPDSRDLPWVLATLSALASSYAVVFDEHTRSVGLASSVVVHEQSAPWVIPLFAALAIIQVIDAEEKAEGYAQLLGGVPHRSRHPQSGLRRNRDEMLATLRELYRPLGEEPSRWIASGEFEELPLLLKQGGFHFSAGGRYGLTTELPFGTGSALISATASEPHPELGNGLYLRLSLPVKLPREAAARLALELNAAEATSFCGSHLLGGWGVKERDDDEDAYVPEFVSFVPNILYQPGLLFTLILSLGLKARWARSQIAPYASTESLKRSRWHRLPGVEEE